MLIRNVGFMVNYDDEVLQPYRIPCYPEMEFEVVLEHELVVTEQNPIMGYAATVSPDPQAPPVSTQSRATATAEDSIPPFSSRNPYSSPAPSSTRERPTVQAMVDRTVSVAYSDIAPLPMTPDTDDRSARASSQGDTEAVAAHGTGPTSCGTEGYAPDEDGAADNEPARPKSGPLLSLDADSYLTYTDLGMALVQCSASMALGGSFIQGYKGIFALFVQDFLAGRCTGADSLKKLMTDLLDKVLGEMERGNDVNMRERALTLQQEAIVRLGILQYRIQAMMTKTYELFENTVPRLFIILRVGDTKLDRMNSSNNGFRLYFICECGKHTEGLVPATPTPRPKHHIHISQHRGYDLVRPNAFLAKFGPYVLTVMEMVRYGITAEEFVVPPMANFKVLEGIDTLEEHDLDSTNFLSALDDTMDFIRGHLGRNLKPMNVDPMDMMHQAVLENYELHQLGSFLVHDGNPRPCGDLYRIVTAEGFVKWVCTDHFRYCDRALTLEYLQAVIDPTTGILGEKEGSATVTCPSSQSAREFYDVLQYAGCVYDLEMNIRWEATKADVKDLCNAVIASNVLNLTLRGLTGQERSLGQVDRESRLGYLTRLMDSGKLQVLTIEGYELLDSGLGLGGTDVHGLRKLELGLGNFSKSIQDSFFRLLKRLTDLVDLRLHCVDMDQVYDILQRQLRTLHLPQLAVLTFISPQNTVSLNRKAGTMSMLSICPASKRMIDDHENLTTIHMPFDDDKLASTISWFERQHAYRSQPLVLSFSTGSHDLGITGEEILEPVVEVEFEYQAPSGSVRPVGQRLKGHHSTMYIRWCDDDLAGCFHEGGQDVTEVAASGSSTVLDVQALKTRGIRKILQSLVIHPQHNGLEIICCPCSEDLVKLIFAGLNTRSLSRLARLRLSGETLNDWILDLSRVLTPQSLPALEELCVASATLSPESTNWISSMLSPRSLQRIAFKDLRIATSHWRRIISSMDLTSTRYIDFSGSTMTLPAFEAMVDKVPQNSRLETLELRGVRWTGVTDQRECSSLVWQLKAKATSVEVKYQQ